MNVYDSHDNILISDVLITRDAQHEEELMKSDFVKLSWDSATGTEIPVDTYIIPYADNVRYRLLEPYYPEQKTENSWHYEPQFQHPKMYLGKVTFKRPSYDSQANQITLLDWSYTGNIRTLLQYFCDQINNALGLTENLFSPAVVGMIDNVISISFSTQDILSALSASSNVLNCEYHLDWETRILYFGHIIFDREEVDTPILEVDGNIGVPSVRSSREGYWNAFEPQGSTRNISTRAASGENVQSNVRLSLRDYPNAGSPVYPDGIIYTDGNGNIITKAQFEAQGYTPYIKSLIFDNVYPRLDLFVYDVRGRERYLLDDDGKKVIDHYNGSTPVYKKYTVWYMRLAYPTYNQDGTVSTWTDFFKKGTGYKTLEEVQGMIIDGKSLMAAFQANTRDNAETSPLAGRGDGDGDGSYGFGLIYHDTAETIPAGTDGDGDTGVQIKAGDVEIVFQQEDDYILPTTQAQGIIPKGKSTPSLLGNVVNIYNIVMDSSYVSSAKNELENETKKYIAKDVEDKNTYTFNAKEDVFETSNPNLYIGRRVIYKNGTYQLTTRVMKLVTKLDYSFQQEITVGNEVLKGNQTQLKEKVDTLISYMSSEGGISESQIRRLIENWCTPRFLSKINDDTAAGFITFLKGISVSELSYFLGGLSASELSSFLKGILIGNDGIYGIDENGDAKLREIIAKSLQSSNYMSGLRGWNIDANGNAEVGTLHVRDTLEVDELRINRQQAQEGDTIFSDNDQILDVEEHVDETDGSTSYVLTLKEKWEGYFTAQMYGNILRGKINTLAAKEAGVSDYSEDTAGQERDSGRNLYYTSFMTVTATHNTTPSLLGVNQIRVVLWGDDDVPMSRNFPPCAMMTIARWGCVDYSDEYVDDPSYEAVKSDIKRRQQLFVLSSNDGRITKLVGVSKPILEDGNIGATFGTLPEFVRNNNPEVAKRVIEGRDYLYAQGVVVGDFIQTDIQGVPIPTVVNVGDWVDGAQIQEPSVGNGIYLSGEFNEQNQRYETHAVRHRNGTWKCLMHQPVKSGGSTTYYEPKWNSPYWQLIDGDGRKTIEFSSSNGFSFRRGVVNTVITPHLFYGNVEISDDIATEFWYWNRSTLNTDTGEYEQDEQDLVWNTQHVQMKTLSLSNNDMPIGWSLKRKAIFTCCATILDGLDTITIENYITV